ncbi:MAG: DNA alkylation repair protein, partial [Bacteroidia bacterium]|nr:DNA alkylation repair protein [Bacteroidia bacterium]
MKLHPLVSALRSEFEAHADAETAEGMEKYMRDQFRFLGIKKPLRARLLLPYVKEFRALPEEEWPQVAKQIWDLPRREYQYAAMELCAKKLKSYLPGHLELFEYMIQDR